MTMTFDFRRQFERVEITFYTVLVKREFLPRDIGAEGEADRSTSLLAAFVFMAPVDAENSVDVLKAQGLVIGLQVGVADMMTGPLVRCDDIQYLRNDDSFPPTWSAFRLLSHSEL